MKVSELITQLQSLQAKHGDVTASIADADTAWTLEIMYVGYDKKLNCIDVGADYADRITERRGAEHD